MSGWLSVCLSIGPPVFHSLHLYIYLPVRPSVYLSPGVSICPSFYPFTYLTVRLSVCRYVLYVCISYIIYNYNLFYRMLSPNKHISGNNYQRVTSRLPSLSASVI